MKLHRRLLIRLKRYRRLLLTELRRFGKQTDPDSYLLLDPKDILGRPGDSEYVNAIHELLGEELIVGQRTPEGGAAFRINPSLLQDVRQELAWWRDPFWQFLAIALIALAGFLVAFIPFL